MSSLPPIVPTPKQKPDLQVIPADVPHVEVTEQERRQQEAQEYLDSLKPNEKMTEERIQEIRAATLASVPMVDGKPVPEPSGLTQEQMRNNPSNYQPAIEQSTQALNSFTGVSSETMAPSVTHVVNADTFAQQPAPAADEDRRQAWVCVQSDGIRTMDNAGQVHPMFRSDAHLADVMVRCPVCDSVSVRKVYDGEDLSLSEKAAAWTRERTVVMGLNPLRGRS